MMGTATKTNDMIDILVQDHREVEEPFREMESPGTDPDRRRELASVAIAELVRHSIAEEEHLYPATREVCTTAIRSRTRKSADHRWP